MIMGNVPKLVLTFCLVLTVTDSAMVRIKREHDGEANPGSHCKDIRVTNGGIKLYPVGSDHHHPADDSCYTNPYLDCEFRFYCDEGYESIGQQYIQCVDSEFVGTFPTCQPVHENNQCKDQHITIHHGGIMLFPSSTETTDPLMAYPCDFDWHGCEPRLYCDDGYEDSGTRYIYCGTSTLPGVNVWKYVGDTPNCERKVQRDSTVDPTSSTTLATTRVTRQGSSDKNDANWLKKHIYVVGIIPGLILVMIIALVARALRIRHVRPRRNIHTTSIDITPPPSTASNGHSSGGTPGYARFNDSHIQVN